VAIRVWSLRRCNRHTPTTARAAGRGARQAGGFRDKTRRRAAGCWAWHRPDSSTGAAERPDCRHPPRRRLWWGTSISYPRADAEVRAQSARRLDMNGPTSTPTGDRRSKAAHQLPGRRSLAVRLQCIWDVHLERWDLPDWALASLYSCACSQAGRYADRCKGGNSPKPNLTGEAAAAGCLHGAAPESCFAEVGM
jgi:hypothetical protein